MTTDEFELDLPALGAGLRVARFSGTEAVNENYGFDVFFMTEQSDEVPSRTLETPATLTIRFGGEAVRLVHGVVAECEATGFDDRGTMGFVAHIVPRFALLELRRTSRVFQDSTTREIVDYVLGLSRIKHRWNLERPLQKRPYCVQYDETDLAFVTRLLASEGIFYFFEHPSIAEATLGNEDADPSEALAPSELLVFCDSVSGYAPIKGDARLAFRALGEGSALTAQEDHVHTFAFRRSTKPKRVLFRRFDFRRPPIQRMDSAALDKVATPETREALRSFVDAGATVYRHENAREEALLDSIAAPTALEAETAGATLSQGESPCRRLLPGHTFLLSDHPVSEANGGFVVLSAVHEASEDGSTLGGTRYRARFKSAPAKVPLRAALAKRAVRQSIETAVVVGPKGSEIHTDEYGRVKVQFHWDLQNEFDDKSSTWLRVMQPWAGSGYGAQFLPRVGHEVIVGYLDGDPDRPVVLGSLHNATMAPPYTYPRDRAMSGIKTLSTPGGAGAHELLFQDSAGVEFVRLQSMRRLELGSSAEATFQVGDDLQMGVGANFTQTVSGDAFLEFRKSVEERVMQTRDSSVGVDDKLAVKGTRTIQVDGDEGHHTEGVLRTLVGTARDTIVGTNLDVPAHDFLSVSGRRTVASGEEMRISSQREVRIDCGASAIILRPGEILISSPKVQIQATDEVSLLQGDPAGATLVLKGSATMAAGVAIVAGGGKPGEGPSTLVLDTEAHLDAPMVKINCQKHAGGGGDDEDAPIDTGAATFNVSPEDLPPGTTSVTLVISTPDGSIIEREVAPGGSVTLDGPKGGVFTVVKMKIGSTSVPVMPVPSGPGPGEKQ